ncbi:MAG: TIGR00282 family metallophosphoesterase [Deltaproteobacteria bacterium]|nr:TIGR00282 family metallophosphoesterase [Deltaproteobacteria bacterium]
MSVNILFIGDIVGKPGRKTVREILPLLMDRFQVDLVIANGENVSGGIGISVKGADELLSGGIHVLTSGNHIWKKKEIQTYIQQNPDLIRPANYPAGTPGNGSVIKETRSGHRIGILNLLGRTFMEAVDCPFRRGLEERERLIKETSIILVDFHAEATSEKVALGWFLDGKVSAVLGTHTHVQTSDERILPQGTAYMTDAGMTGPADSVIGVKKELAIERFLTQMPHKFEVAKRELVLEGALISIDPETGRATEITRIRERVNISSEY